jgi:hypothetical protein
MYYTYSGLISNRGVKEISHWGINVDFSIRGRNEINLLAVVILRFIAQNNTERYVC